MQIVRFAQFFAMVDFCNPGALGDANEFRKKYARPILRSREPDATPAQRELGNARNEALSGIVNQFILRRTNALLSAHLPPKVLALRGSSWRPHDALTTSCAAASPCLSSSISGPYVRSGFLHVFLGTSAADIQHTCMRGCMPTQCS